MYKVLVDTEVTPRGLFFLISLFQIERMAKERLKSSLLARRREITALQQRIMDTKAALVLTRGQLEKFSFELSLVVGSLGEHK